MANPDRAAIERARSLLQRAVDTGSVPASIGLIQRTGKLDGYKDHAAILVATSLLEQCLEDAIWRFSKVPDAKAKLRLFGTNDKDYPGPLTSLWAKTQMAYVLGAVGPKAFEGLEKIRHIRNLFAHAKEAITFETKEVADLCHFGTDDSIFWGGLMGPPPATPRDRALGFMQLTGLALIDVEADAGEIVGPYWDDKIFGRLVG